MSRGGELGVGQRLVDASEGLFQQRQDEAFVVVAENLHLQVALAVEIFLADVHERLVGKGALGALQDDLEAAEGAGVLGKFHAVLALEFLHRMVHEQLVKIVAAQMRVAVAGFDLYDALFHHHHRHVERAAAEVIDEHGFALGDAGAVGQRGGGGFVDDADDFQAREVAGRLGGFALALVEEGGDGDDGFGDRLAQLPLGFQLQFAQDEGGDFFGRKLPVAELHLGVFAHLALDGHHGVFRSGDELVLGGLADDEFAGGVEADRRGHDGITVDGQHFDLAVAEDGEFGVGGAEVNADDEFVHGEKRFKVLGD